MLGEGKQAGNHPIDLCDERVRHESDEGLVCRESFLSYETFCSAQPNTTTYPQPQLQALSLMHYLKLYKLSSYVTYILHTNNNLMSVSCSFNEIIVT